MSLSSASIFDARPILRNFNAKKSAFIDNHRNSIQILCLVSESNEILVRYRYYGIQNIAKYLNNKFSDDDEENVGKTTVDNSRNTDCEHFCNIAQFKLIVWFQKTGKIIQDLCFDPSGRHLLVVCYDNTLHIVPILWIINPEFGLKTTTSQELETFYWPFRSDEITSFIVPFSGPHECSNSKTCPNTSEHVLLNEENSGRYTPTQINDTVLASNAYQSLNSSGSKSDVDSNVTSSSLPSDDQDDSNIIEKSPDGCEKITATCSSQDDSVEAVETQCPFPLSVVWWSTTKIIEHSHQHRAIIGYSDGSICVVGLAPNCPLIANTSINRKSGGVTQMIICRESMIKNVSLLISSSSKEQWKLLLEQNSIGYVYPDENNPKSKDSSTQSNTQSTDSLTAKQKTPDHGWQIVISVPPKATGDQPPAEGATINTTEKTPQATGEPIPDDISAVPSTSGILPAAARRLLSLKDLGARKIGALKMKLIENNAKANERDRNRHNMGQLACMEIPSLLPELLTGSSGPYFIVQHLNNKHFLSALHTYSDTLSVHHMDANFIPLHLYKVPRNCSNVLLTSNVMYTVQNLITAVGDATPHRTDIEHENDENLGFSPIKSAKPKQSVDAIGIVGCSSSVLKIGDDSEINAAAMLGLFSFADEKIIDIHRVPYQSSPPSEIKSSENEQMTPAPAPAASSTPLNPRERLYFQQPKITTENYFHRYSNDSKSAKAVDTNDDILFGFEDKNILEHTFPSIALDQCLVVTNQSVVSIEFKSEPHVMFLNLVKNGEWTKCEEFCKLFELDYNQCVEYGGDVLLKRKQITQALLAYNAARVLPIKTALKLAMFGENNALMHLCAMALKIAHVLESAHPKSHVISYVMSETGLCENNISRKLTKTERNCGKATTNFSYDRDETPSDLQMSNSSQFHLSNLLLLTLTERAIKENRLMPLWNFLVTNKRFHTNMSSIVLAQSGLYSAVSVLALNRGAQLDVFCALIGVVNQQFGWYSEFNSILFQLSDTMYMECIIYLQSISMDYLTCLQKKCDQIDEGILGRLRHQLDPFSAIFRPAVSQLSASLNEGDSNAENKKLIEFCKQLVETFLMIIIRLYTLKCTKDEITNGLNAIYVHHEHNQFAIKIGNGSNISAGFSHAAAIVDGCCYLWGSNGFNCALSGNVPSAIVDASSETAPKCLEFMSTMNLEVHAVKSGKSHTLILTNNGLYAMGSNLYQQLGIGKRFIQALQPMLIPEFDGKNVTLIETGQYHNAVYADNQLYTFGWNIYGQLGHGHIQSIEKPMIVQFFDDKRIKQIALGHAHTLVLCGNNATSHGATLYVFGCNFFGQLGLGQYEHLHQKFIKSTIPRRFDLIDEHIVQIHTKFFTNFAVTKHDKLYTWGASPQFIRLMNQSRKRERMARKIEETTNAQAKEQEEQTTSSIEAERSNKDVDEKLNDANNISDKSNGGGDDKFVTGVDDKPIARVSDKPLTKIENECDQEASGSDEAKTKNSKHHSHGNLEERIKSLWRTKSPKKMSSIRAAALNNTKPNDKHYVDDDYTEHFYPAQVDTSEVDAKIVQISSGLYHNALVTTTMQLYTWGRNLEKQLGRENTRCDIPSPMQLELNENVISVECGADFTIYQTDNFTIKAFGNNNVGQCGHEMTNTSDRGNMGGKLVRLRVSKRIVRLPDTSHCTDKPFEVSLPRPKIRMNYDAVRYLKSMPKYQPEFISREIFRDAGFSDHSSYSDSNAVTPDTNHDIVCSLAEQTSKLALSNKVEAISLPPATDVTSDFVHYCLFILHGIYDAHKILSSTTINQFKVRILMLNYYVKEAFSLCLAAAKDTIAMHQSQENVHLGNIMLINYVIRLFEYFTKDATVVPIHRTDLKYLIHAIFMYFIENALVIEPLEAYFLNNIDHYLFGLAFVLFFTNNNTKLERKVQQKYSHLFSGCLSDEHVGDSASINTGDDDGERTQPTEQIENSVALDFQLIFKHVSVRFKTIICQRLIEFDKELN